MFRWDGKRLSLARQNNIPEFRLLCWKAFGKPGSYRSSLVGPPFLVYFELSIASIACIELLQSVSKSADCFGSPQLFCERGRNAHQCSMRFRMIPGYYALSALSVITIISSCYAQPETVTGTFTVEQPGTDNCLTLEAARPGFDDDRFVASRCREGSTSQKFTVDAVYDEERSQFSLASSDRKCVYVDSLDQLRRSESLCDKNLNYFFAQSASDMRNSGMGGGQGIRIKHWPSEKCLTSSFDSGVNVQVCEPGNTKQKWRVCRSDDTESCLRFFEL